MILLSADLITLFDINDDITISNRVPSVERLIGWGFVIGRAISKDGVVFLYIDLKLTEAGELKVVELLLSGNDKVLVLT